MKKFKRIILVVLIIGVGFFATGCTPDSSSTSIEEQKLTEENQKKLLNAQPPVKLDWSLERENINRRTNLWNDENKISYIYLVSYGKVMAFYVIKGKVSSVNSQITNPEQIANSYSQGGFAILPSPAEDGSYGTNGDGIFFFDTNGVYFEWSGNYLLVDQPMQLNTPPQIVRQIK